MVWKILDFSVILILREINFGEPRNPKSAILGAMNFINLVISPLKSAKIHRYQNSNPPSVSNWANWQILHF